MTRDVGLRLTWGAVLLVMPERLLRSAHGGPVPTPVVAAARALGARHVLQGALTAATGNRTAGAAVDGLHIASLLVLAAVAPRWRRVVLADAVVEIGLAAAHRR